jgi:4-amino-4-deoxy-L-arabinose transferase-like glycosyltransferase
MRRRDLLILFGLALAVRIVFVAWAPGLAVGDGLFYDLHARALLEGHGYVNADGSPGIRWMPGWPGLLALLYAIFGATPKVGMFANAVFGAATCGLLAALGARLFDRRTGTLAGLFAAVWPGLVYYSATLMTETLFGFLLVSMLLLLVIAVQARPQGDAGFAAAGLAFGTCAWVKSEPLIFAPALLLFLWVARTSTAAFVRSSLITLLVTAALLAPWTIRNQRAFDRFLPTTANGGAVVFLGNHAGASGGNDFGFARAYAKRHGGADDAASLLARNGAGWRDAFAFARDHPEEELTLMARKLALTYRGDSDAADLIRGFGAIDDWHLSWTTWRRLVLVADAWWFALLALVVFGLTGLRRWRIETRVLLLGLIASWTALHLVFLGGPRFRVPEAPAFALFAAVGADRLLRLRARPR